MSSCARNIFLSDWVDLIRACRRAADRPRSGPSSGGRSAPARRRRPRPSTSPPTSGVPSNLRKPMAELVDRVGQRLLRVSSSLPVDAIVDSTSVLRRRWSSSSDSKRRTSSIGTSSSLPLVPAQIDATWSSTGNGLYWPCLSSSIRRAPRASCARRRRVEVGREHRERLERAVLREVELQRAGDLLHRLDLRGTTDAGHRDADVDGGALVGVEQVRLQEDLAVGDGDDVGRDVRRDVVRLGLDDRQTGHRARAQLVGELRATLEQTGVQVEDVTGVRLAARRAAQQQRHGAVRLGLLRQVVEDDEDVLALVHPVLADGRAGVRARGT